MDPETACTVSREYQCPRGKPLSVDFSNRCRVSICPQSARWLHPAESEQSANPTIQLLNPRYQWTRVPELVCFLGPARIGPRPSVRAATATSPERHTPWHARKLRSSLETCLPIPLPQENCLADTPRGPCKVENKRHHCLKSPLEWPIGPLIVNRLGNSAGEDNLRQSAGQCRDLLSRRSRPEFSGRVARKQIDHESSPEARPQCKTSSNLPVDTASWLWHQLRLPSTCLGGPSGPTDDPAGRSTLAPLQTWESEPQSGVVSLRDIFAVRRERGTTPPIPTNFVGFGLPDVCATRPALRDAHLPPPPTCLRLQEAAPGSPSKLKYHDDPLLRVCVELK